MLKASKIYEILIIYLDRERIKKCEVENFFFDKIFQK